MFVSVVIPVYKRTEWLKRCLQSLNKQTLKEEFEIIIVDDGSPNQGEITEIIEGVKIRKNIHIIFLRQQNRGPAAARNYGISKSSGKIICFLDDDSIASTTWLEHITRPIMESKADFVSGKTLSYYRDLELPVLLERSVYNGISWATCNIAYKREIIENLGGFDESFKEPSWEDNEMALRTIWAGYRHQYNREAIVYHPHERTIDEYKKKCLLNGRGAARFFKKYILKKPLWGIFTPVAMSRRLVYFLTPSVLLKRQNSASYVKFLWSYYSLKGFVQEIKGNNAKNKES